MVPWRRRARFIPQRRGYTTTIPVGRTHEPEWKLYVYIKTPRLGSSWWRTCSRSVWCDWNTRDCTHYTAQIVRAPIEPETGEYRSAGQQARYDKRRMAQDALEQVREELFSGEWDGLVLFSSFLPRCWYTFNQAVDCIPIWTLLNSSATHSISCGLKHDYYIFATSTNTRRRSCKNASSPCLP